MNSEAAESNKYLCTKTNILHSGIFYACADHLPTMPPTPQVFAKLSSTVESSTRGLNPNVPILSY